MNKMQKINTKLNRADFCFIEFLYFWESRIRIHMNIEKKAYKVSLKEEQVWEEEQKSEKRE